MTYDPSWAAIIAKQEELLLFDRFTNADALTLGLYAIDAAKAFGKSFSIHIIANGATVFLYHMDGTNLENDWWMDKKMNMSRECGTSTLRLFAEMQSGIRERPWQLDDAGSYAFEGGCVPMRMRDGRVFGYMTASGASHELDHEVVVRAMARLLGVEIPTVAK